MSLIPVSMIRPHRAVISYDAMQTSRSPLRWTIALLCVVLPATAAHAQAKTAERAASAAAQAQPELQAAQATGGIEMPHVSTPSPRPDTGPIQWRWQHALKMKGRDLALAQGLRLADMTIPWNDSVMLSAAKAESKQNGSCVFHYEYATRNIGLQSTTATKNSILRGGRGGLALARDRLPALAAGADSASSGTLSLASGTTTLYVYADAIGIVSETDEANNSGKLTVTVTGNCG